MSQRDPVYYISVLYIDDTRGKMHTAAFDTIYMHGRSQIIIYFILQMKQKFALVRDAQSNGSKFDNNY